MRSGAMKYVPSSPLGKTKPRTTKVSAAALKAAKLARQRALFDAAMKK